MKKSFCIIIAVILAISVCLFASCGESNVVKEPLTNPERGGWYSSDESAAPSDTPSKNAGEIIPKAEGVLSDRKIISTYRLSAESLDFDRTIDRIIAELNTAGGYVASSNTSGSSKEASRYVSYTLRVPAASASSFVSFISEEVNLLSSSLTTDDITDAYYDYKARFDSLTLQEERLLAMLEKADTLDYMLKIEDKLASVRSELNAIYSQLQRMDKSVDYAYVYLTVREVAKYQPVKEPTYFEKLGDAFVGAFDFFGDFFSTVFLGVVWALPFLILAAVIVTLLIVAERKKKKQKSESNKKE